MPKKLDKTTPGPRCNACLHGIWQAPYWYCIALDAKAHWAQADDPDLSCHSFMPLRRPRRKNAILSQDLVKRPAHYTQGKIEPMDFIIDQKFDYLEGNIVKYLCRYKYKGTPLLDLKKMREYADRLIQREEGK